MRQRKVYDNVCVVGHVVLDSPPQAVAYHLRWILQKDLLGQDMFLIGPPGPLRRSVAMQYLVRKINNIKCTGKWFDLQEMFL